MSDPARPRLVRVAGRTTWYIYHQRRRLSTGCEDRAGAELVLARYRAELDRPQLAVISITSILDRYLANRQSERRPGAERLRWAHKPLHSFFGEKPPELISAADVRVYIRRREADGVKSGTVRTELQALQGALRWAHGEKLIGPPPPLPLPPKPPPRERWLTREEAARLVDACARPHIKLFVQLALQTAGRASALLGLTWDRVDLEQGRINLRDPTVARSKKGRAVIPITDALRPALVEAYEGRTTEWVVEWAGGRVGSVKRAFREACARADLTGVTPHTLRHTAATWMAQAGVPMSQIAGYLGHSSTQMVEQVYIHHSPDHMREAAAALSGNSDRLAG
jgi:integrase